MCLFVIKRSRMKRKSKVMNLAGFGSDIEWNES